MTTVSKEHISKTPGICGGKACIAGHRIRVMDVVVMYERWGFSPDQIADQYPGLTLADVHAALAYYFDHPAEIAAEFAYEAAVAEQYRAKFPSKLRGKAGG